MANERTFVTSLMKAIEKAAPGSMVWKPADSFNLGVPDIHVVLCPSGKFIAAEVKRLPRLLIGSLDETNVKPLLKHRFTGPQISFMRKLKDAGAGAYLVVQTHQSAAYHFDPYAIGVDGQVTQSFLAGNGRIMTRSKGWTFWE